MASEAADIDAVGARGFRLALFAVTALGLLIRLVAATRVPIGYDEFWHVFIARNLTREIGNLAHPPLFILLVRGFDALWSSSWSYRGVSIVSGTAVVALFGHILRRIGIAPLLSLAGALGAAVAGSLVLLSLTVEAYMLCAAFVLASFAFALDLFAPEPRLRSRVGFAIFASLALLSHYAAGLYLATIVVAVALLRPRAAAGPRQGSRLGADLATLAPPLVTGATLYVLLARPWVRVLSHLPTFYFDAARESVPEFLRRNLAATAAILFPAPFSEPLPWVVLLSAFVALVAWLSASATADATENARRRLPASVLVLLLVIGIAGGISGKYPFGGMMRHQMLLLLFGPLAAWVALDSLARRRPASWRRLAVPAIALAGLAVSGTLTAREIARAHHVSWPGVEAFERDFPSTTVVHLDQFNLIGFFMEMHGWRWRYLGPLGPPGVEAYRLTRDGRTRTVIAHRGRWNMDLYEPGVYRDIASVLRATEEPCGVLWIARQFPYDVAPSRDQMRVVSREAGLQLAKSEVSTRLILGRLCTSDSASAAAPFVDRVLPESARRGVAFQVQPDGSSALSIEGGNFGPNAVVELAGQRLATIYGSPEWLTAAVPAPLTARAARLELRVVDPARGASDPVSFEVLP